MTSSGGAGHELGRLLMVGGLVLLLVGAGLYFSPRVPWLGRLPGDFHYQRGNFSFYFPLTTIVILNLVLFFVMRLFRR